MSRHKLPPRDAAWGWSSVVFRGPWLWVVPIAFFFLVAVLEATHAYIGYRLGGGPVFGLTLRGQPMSWLDFLGRTSPSWMLVGALTPLVLTAMRRFPPGEGDWRRNLLIHALGAVVFAGLFITGAAALRYGLFLRHEIDTSYGHVLIRYYAIYFNLFFLIYFALAAVYAAMRNHTRHRDALILERDLTEARLQALQAQLRPHFLFNALNAITTLAREGDKRTLVRMLTALAELLRASFREPGVQLIPLRDELTIVRHYLDLERIRFPDRLSVDIRIDPSTRDAVVPRFVLQPLVENAIRHGIAPLNRPGRVTISSGRRNGTIELFVDDTGPGLAPGAADGTGLGHTRRRLEHAFGGTAALELQRSPEGGARAIVRLPAVFAVSPAPEPIP